MVTQSDVIASLIQSARTIAVMGLSANPERPSHEVAAYLQRHGYRIVPVNPSYAGEHILGQHCYATLSQAAEDLRESSTRIDIVDCFRRSEHMEEVAEQAVAAGASALWMQLGVVNQAAAKRAADAGLVVVMDRCLKIEHMGLAG